MPPHQGKKITSSARPRNGAREVSTRTGARRRTDRSANHHDKAEGLSIIQINLNNSRRAHDLLIATTKARNTQVAILSEPSASRTGGQWLESTDGRAAILLLDGDIPCRLISKEVGHVTALLGKTEITSCYYSPNATTEDFVEYLGEIEQVVAARKTQRKDNPTRGTIVAGDLNAWSTA